MASGEPPSSLVLSIDGVGTIHVRHRTEAGADGNNHSVSRGGEAWKHRGRRFGASDVAANTVEVVTTATVRGRYVPGGFG